MRFRWVLAVLLGASLALVAVCGPGGLLPPGDPEGAPATRNVQFTEEFTLAPGGAARLSDVLTVRFVGVVEDRRCPQEVACDGPGNAEVAIAIIRDRSEPVIRVLHTHRRRFAAKTTHGGRIFHLLELSPKARLDGVPIEEYRARLKVSRER